MKRFTEFINEKLKVSKNSIYDITLESLIKALNDYKDRKHYAYSVYITLKAIFEEYPVVLQYHGTYKDQNIVGEKMKGIQLITYNNPIYNQVSKTDTVFIYFDQNMLTDSIQIENTKELYDIFGEEALYKIYDYIVNH